MFLDTIRFGDSFGEILIQKNDLPQIYKSLKK